MMSTYTSRRAAGSSNERGRARSFAAAIAVTLGGLAAACSPPGGGAPSTASPAHSAAASAGSGAVREALSDEQRRAYADADAIVVATLVDPKIESVAEREPPIYIHSFGLAVDKRLVGMPLPAGRVRFVSDDLRHQQPFAAGARMIVAIQRVERTLDGAAIEVNALRVDPATPALEAALVGVPAPATDELRLTVSQVPPASPGPNVYGDGLFDLTITNDGKAPRAVPFLQVDGGRTRFEDLLVIRQGGRDLRLPATRPISPTPLVLAPGASVTTRVDVKRFGLDRMPGGERIYYSFQLGPLRASSFFYFVNSLHGPQMGKP